MAPPCARLRGRVPDRRKAAGWAIQYVKGRGLGESAKAALTARGFAELLRFARAYGGHGETVEKTAEFAPAFERARASGKQAIIEVKLDPEAITPTRTLTQIREGR